MMLNRYRCWLNHISVHKIKEMRDTMLDQNTDRMLFLLGAVIVGAAILVIMEGALPNMFGNIVESFKESIGAK